MKEQKIILLAGEGDSTNILYNKIQPEYAISSVIVEEGISKSAFLKRRIKRLGIGQVIGQILFQVFAIRALHFFSKKRIDEIYSEFALNKTAIPNEKIKHVPSVNSDVCIQLIQELQPSLILVSGTRIISKKVLASIDCPFINIHAGVTPFYRGVHGAYWALANNDLANCGVTVHLVDKGIDTGNIIHQKRITISPKDNFYTYPLLQLARGTDLLLKAIREHFEGGLPLTNSEEKGKVWYHPTLWFYMKKRLFNGVK